MIVNIGKLDLLTMQKATLETYYWGLYTNDRVPTSTDSLAFFDEPTFTGYAQILMPSLTTPTIVDDRAYMTTVEMPTWVNEDAEDATIYGWLLLDNLGTGLIAATYLGETLIPGGQSFAIAPRFTDTNEV